MLALEFILHKKHWLIPLSMGVITGLIAAGAMTLVDWGINPGGIFRSDLGTTWTVVAETAGSGFFPVAVVASTFAAPVIFLFGRARK